MWKTILSICVVKTKRYFTELTFRMNNAMCMKLMLTRHAASNAQPAAEPKKEKTINMRVNIQFIHMRLFMRNVHSDVSWLIHGITWSQDHRYNQLRRICSVQITKLSTQITSMKSNESALNFIFHATTPAGWASAIRAVWSNPYMLFNDTNAIKIIDLSSFLSKPL